MIKYVAILSQLFLSLLMGETVSAKRLFPYKELLELGTYENQDWSSFQNLPLSRYETFKKAFELFEQREGNVIVELGTSRSYNHGGLQGCNQDDPGFWRVNQPETWDWGAGFFTRMAVHSLLHKTPDFHTVDLIKSHIFRCQIMTLEYSHLLKYHVSSSQDFLRQCQFKKGIDLLYLDTGDMTPIEPTALVQLEEAKIIVERDLMAPRGLILIDDVRNQTPVKFGETSGLGKSKYALPYLLDHGFEIIMDGYQVLLQKKDFS